MSLTGSLVLLSLAISPTAYLCSQESKRAAAQTPQTARGVQHDDADTARLKKAICDASSRLKLEKEGLKTIYVHNQNSQQSLISGVYFKDATARVESGKETLMAGLDSPNLEALKAHVKKFYPRPRLDVIAFDSRHDHGSVELIAVVSEESVGEAFAAAEKYIATINAVAVNSVLDLEVRSTETLATCKLFVSARQRREVTTNDTTKNLPRGYYTYTVTKNGYKTATGELDLVDDDGTLLDCTMFKEADSNGPSKCQLK
jgi:hypothetical protein